MYVFRRVLRGPFGFFLLTEQGVVGVVFRFSMVEMLLADW
jgi:hypothetical protein